MLWLSMLTRAQTMRVRGVGVRDDCGLDRFHDTPNTTVRVRTSDTGLGRYVWGEDS